MPVGEVICVSVREAVALYPLSFGGLVVNLGDKNNYTREKATSIKRVKERKKRLQGAGRLIGRVSAKEKIEAS